MSFQFFLKHITAQICRLVVKVKESEVSQSCSTLCNPMDCSLPGSSIHGIFQARVVEWGAIASPGDLPDPGIEAGSATG